MSSSMVNVNDYIFLSSLLIIFLLAEEKQDPINVLAGVAFSILALSLVNFLHSMEYWVPIAILLSFLVGLFLLFVYMISFVKNTDLGGTNVMFPYKVFLFFWSFFLMLYFFNNKSKMIVDESFNFNQESKFSVFFENSNDLILFSLLIFTFFIMFLFFIMKKNKKNMKGTF